MPAGGEVLVAGQYIVTYNSVAVGIMEGDASVPTIEVQNKGKPIDSTDRYAKATIDALHHGADYFAQFTCLEYKAGSLACLWPFGTLGIMGIIARLYFNLAAPLVLTSIAGTPAANSPATLTAPKAIIAPGYNGRLLFGPDVRVVPVRQILLPVDFGGGTIGWFSQT